MGGKIQKSGELNKANGHLYVHNDCNHSHVEKDLNHDKPTYKGCGPIDAIINAHLIHIQHRIKELVALEEQRKELNAFCSADRSIDKCCIVQKLTADESDSDLSLTAPTNHLGGH